MVQTGKFMKTNISSANRAGRWFGTGNMMNSKSLFRRLAGTLPGVLLWLAVLPLAALGQSVSNNPNVKLTLSWDGPELKIHWPSQSVGNDGMAVFPEFEVQRSTDLSHWQPVGERQRGSAALPDLSLGLGLGTDQPLAFYRLLVVGQPPLGKLGSGGAEVLATAMPSRKRCSASAKFHRMSSPRSFPAPQ